LSIESVDLNVTGMTCAACQANVQRALTRQAGVSGAAVNLMTGQARVVFDPALTDPAQLMSAVEAIGYGAELPSTELSATAAQQARDASVTPTSTDPEPLWAVTWRVRSAAWMLTHRRTLERALR